MDQSVFSRIDRAVADNIRDIQRSFGNQAGLVQDFIVFYSSQLKTDLFGYTRFTIQQFCKQSGRSRQELSMIHPNFASGKNLPPVIQGYPFQTVMEYALYSMMERNIIFSSKYEVKDNGTVVQMYNFPILKDLKLNFNRRNNEQKVYEIRLSDELIYGFLGRYYTINTDSYRLVGKGRGGDSRKKLLLYLSKLSHVMHSSQHIDDMIVPLSRLCDFGDIHDIKPSHRKQNLIRMLSYIRDTGKFPFSFDFLHGYSTSDYMIRLVFNPDISTRKLQMEHTFYSRLFAGLKEGYSLKKDKSEFITDSDPFQGWLSDRYIDSSLKARVLAQAYYMAMNLNLSQAQALHLITTSQLIKPLNDVR